MSAATTAKTNPANSLHLQHKICCFAFAILLLFLFGLVPSWALSAPTPAIKKERPGTVTPEQQYKAAKDSLLRLEQENSDKNRSDWLNTARLFRSIHSVEKRGSLGAPSLYMAAKTYRRMFGVFKMPQDLEAALSGYLEVADLYPGHVLADDALFDAAECAKQLPGKESMANDLYTKIIGLYPQGDQLEKAKTRLDAAGGSISPVKPTAESPGSAAKNLSLLAPVKYWSSEDYCRIVLQPASPVAYTATVNETAGSPSRRLSIDLANSFIKPQDRNTLPVREGLLNTIQPIQINAETARISLDLHSLADYTLFSLADPYRIVIDIRGLGATKRLSHLEPPPVPPASIYPSVHQPDVVLNVKEPDVIEMKRTVASLVEQKKRKPEPGMSSSASSPSSKEKLSLAQQLGLGIRKIVIDPGHGGKDPGAMAFGLKEKEIVLAIAKKVARILKEHHRYEVVLTRTKDVFIPLEERTAIANAAKGDLFISIHVNAHSDPTKAGVETYFLNLATDANAMRVAALENASSTHSIGELQDILATLMNNSKIDESTRLARFVQTNLVSGLGTSIGKPRDLGVKQAPFYVLIGAEMPAILAEIAFLTNPDEAKNLQNDMYLGKIAEQIAAGIVAYVDHHHTAAVKF